MIATSESRNSDIRSVAPNFDDFEIYASLARPGMGSGVVMLFRKVLDRIGLVDSNEEL